MVNNCLLFERIIIIKIHVLVNWHMITDILTGQVTAIFLGKHEALETTFRRSRLDACMT